MVKEAWLPKHNLGRVVIISSLIFILLVLWLPIGETFYWSLFVREPGFQKFTGLDNFQQILFEDDVFWKSLAVTANFALMAVPGVVLLGLMLAIAVNNIRNLTVRGIFTASFFSAYIVPLVAVALVWRYIYLPGKQGLLNLILSWFDLGPIRWLTSSEWALRSLVFLRIWKEAGYAMVLFLAGLQAIPSTYYDAAKVDGAGFWQRLWFITMPLLMPTLAFVVVITTLSASLAFTEIYVMTAEASTGDRGGPNYATNLMSFHIYNTAIAYGHEGYGSAMAALFFVIMVAIGYIQYRFIRATYEY
jgi:ABC-type sugar transport system permease subunit